MINLLLFIKRIAKIIIIVIGKYYINNWILVRIVRIVRNLKMYLIMGKAKKNLKVVIDYI